MKKLVLSICLVMLCILKANAQEPKMVSTDPSNRNVLIEEFTGRNCGYCPWGQYFVNQTIKENPGRVFTVNIHKQSSLSPTNYPNLNTTNGGELFNTFGVSGIPAAAINRTGATVHPADGAAAVMVNEQLNKEAHRFKVLYVTGGGAMLQGVVEYIQSKTPIEVMCGSHAVCLTLDAPDEMCMPMYSSLVGTLLLGASYRSQHPVVQEHGKRIIDILTEKTLTIFTDQTGY